MSSESDSELLYQSYVKAPSYPPLSITTSSSALPGSVAVDPLNVTVSCAGLADQLSSANANAGINVSIITIESRMASALSLIFIFSPYLVML